MRKSLKLMAVATLAAVTLGTGCFAKPTSNEPAPSSPTKPTDPKPTDPTTPSDPMNPDTPPADPTPTEPATPEPIYPGSYLIKTKLDLTGKGVLPDLASGVITFIADIDDKPFTGLLYLLMNANIPTVSQGLQSVPGWLIDAGGAIGDSLIKDQVYANNPEVTAVLKQIGAVGDMFKSLEIQNQLSIGAKMTGDTYKVSQQFVALGFEWQGQKKAYNFSSTAMANTIIKGKTLTVTNVKTYADFDGMFDGGSVNLPLGEFLIKAINDLVLSPFGYTSLGDLLAEVFPCEDLAAEVGIDSVQTYCELGIAALADVALAPVKNFNLNGVVIGRANLNAFDRKAAEMPDYTTDKLKGDQDITLISAKNTTVQFKAAKFEGERLLNPIVPPQF